MIVKENFNYLMFRVFNVNTFIYFIYFYILVCILIFKILEDEKHFYIFIQCMVFNL